MSHSSYAGCARSIGIIGCRAIWQRTIDKKAVGAIDNGNIDDTLVEGIVASVSDKAYEVIGAVVIVAATNIVCATSTYDVQGLIPVAGFVVETVWLVVWVQISTIQPDSRPDGESSGASKERKGEDASYRASSTGAIRSSRAAAVELAASVLWSGSASSTS